MVNRIISHSKQIILSVFISILLISSVYSIEKPQLNISLNEYIDQTVMYDDLEDAHSDYNSSWVDQSENQSYYKISGEIILENVNEDWTNGTLIDMWVELDYLDQILWLNHSSDSKFSIIYGLNESGSIDYSVNSTGIFNNSKENYSKAMIKIPELNPGENVTFYYEVNPYYVRPPLNFTTSLYKTKVIAGDPLEITDYVENVFDNNTNQNTCIHDIKISQLALHQEFGGESFNFSFLRNDTPYVWGDDSSNAFISNDNSTLNWSVFGGNCFDVGDKTNISYNFSTPETVVATDQYNIMNSTLSYKLDSTISHLGVKDVFVRSEGIDMDVSKDIVDIAKESVKGDSNVTWEVMANFSTSLTNISYNVTEFSLWVSKRNNTGSQPTDPNDFDSDSISGDLLNLTYDWGGMHFSSGVTDINCKIDSKLSSESIVGNNNCEWYFNYSDLPTPIVWSNFKSHLTVENYSLYSGNGNDSIAQIQTHPSTKDNVDNYIKSLYIIVDYWLEIEKNVTSLGNNTFKIEIWLHNKGNQYTPIGMPVTVFDFIPENFEIVTDLKDYNNESIYSDIHSDMYNTNQFNTSINNPNGMSGELVRWQLNYNNSINASLAPGYETGWDDYNATWYAQFEVKGSGEYNIDELYIVGLDPDLVDGAISDLLIELKGGFYSLKSEELSFFIAFLFSLSIMFLVVFKV